MSLNAENPGPDTLRDWVLVYYMAYDNDLSRFAIPIINEIKKGVQADNLLVTVLCDDTERRGLKRYTITNHRSGFDTLPTDNSADIKVLASYLKWVGVQYPARHYAVIFLNHGGQLDEMSLDEWPGPGQPSAWLSARAVARELEIFRRSAPGEVDLVFLQQCGRGSLENLYNFRETAVSIMASQEDVGAPNTYYQTTLKWLASHPEATGVLLARQIMASDDDYSSYACLSGSALRQIPARLNPVIEALFQKRGSPPRLPQGLTPSFRNRCEENFDLIGWLEASFAQNSLPPEPLRNFAQWVGRDLVQVKSNRGGSRGLSGLSLFVPRTRQDWSLYADYPIYRESSLGRLWRDLPQNPPRACSG